VVSSFCVLCDPRVPLKLKDKFYRTVIRPTMLYGTECWPTKKRHVQQLSAAEMRILRWICDNTRRDRVRNDDIRERLGVAPVEEKLMQHRLRWFEHMQRMSVNAPIHNGVIRWTSNKKIGRWRSNLTWEESMKRDLKNWCITKELALDREEWNVAIHVSESWSSVHSFYCLFQKNSLPLFYFFDLAFYCIFSFVFSFLSSFIFPSFSLMWFHL
jgi:hypothetical protein